MMSRVCRRGPTARKRLAGSEIVNGEELAHRSEVLAAAGINTPVGRYHPESRELVFPWLTEQSAREQLRERLCEQSARAWNALPLLFWGRLLHPLAQLHRVKSKNLNLPTFNPWRRIVPRLHTLRADGLGSELVLAKASDTYYALRDAQARDTWRTKRCRDPVHGDFHIGQLMLSRVDSVAWLLDLEDLAAGPPESDLGNFIAHLATSDDLRGNSIEHDVGTLIPLLTYVYETKSGREVDSELTTLYARIALLRRALKFLQRGTVSLSRIEEVLDSARELVGNGVHRAAQG